MRRFSFLFLLFVISVPLSAKDPIKGLPSECEVFRPQYSVSRNDSEGNDAFVTKDGYGQSGRKSLGYWDVMSDRADNVTYKSWTAKETYSKLGFRDKVRIAKIKKDYALVFTVPDEETKYPLLPTEVEWKGWIPMSNLIYLSKTINDGKGQNHKVLLKDNVSASNPECLVSKLYDSPVEEAQTHNLPSSPNSIYYPIKYEVGSNMVLLSLSSDVNSSEVVFGWAKIEDIIGWNSRLCLEPTWDISSVRLFDSLGVNCRIANALEAESAQGNVRYKLSSSNQLNEDPLRLGGGVWRYPVLSSEREYYLCALPGNSSFLDNPSPLMSVISDTPSSAMGTVNIVLVLDGSRQYEPCFPLIAEKIQEMSKESDRYRIGAIIYHDIRTGTSKIETQGLSYSDDSNLYDFIDQGGKYGFRDNLSEAPLLEAIDNATSLFDDGQNFLVVIGGRGDNSDYSLSPSDLAANLAGKGIHTFVLQVQNNPSTAAYRMFGYQIEDILWSSAVSAHPGNVSCQRGLGDEVNTFAFTLLDSNMELFDGMSSIRSGLVSEELFEELFDKLLVRIKETAAANGEALNSSSQYLQLFRKAKVEASHDGVPFFKKVALYDESELDSIISVLKLANDMYTHSKIERDKFIKTLSEAVVSRWSIPVEQHWYKDLGLQQMFAMLAGLDEYPARYKGVPVKEFLSDKDVTPEEMMYIFSQISEKYYRLLEIKANPSRYCSFINGGLYYWVPLEDLM